jgi:hypothetical protein
MLKGDKFTPPWENLLRPHRKIIYNKKNFIGTFWVKPKYASPLPDY